MEPVSGTSCLYGIAIEFATRLRGALLILRITTTMETLIRREALLRAMPSLTFGVKVDEHATLFYDAYRFTRDHNRLAGVTTIGGVVRGLSKFTR